MTTKLPETDVVIIGFGLTGAILAEQLTAAGLNVTAIERGKWRDTASDFSDDLCRGMSCATASGSDFFKNLRRKR